MYEALGSGLVLVGDDRDACKMWCVDGREMFAHVVEECQPDPAWTMRRDFTPHDVCQFSVARAVLGLPAWLRRGEPGCVRSPSIFPLTKSRCFADENVCEPWVFMLAQSRGLLSSCLAEGMESRSPGNERTLANSQFIPRSVRFITSRGIHVHSDRCQKCGTSTPDVCGCG